VTGLDELAEGIDADNPHDASVLEAELEERGVMGALRRAGVRDGDEIRIGGVALLVVHDRGAAQQ
jgi:Obg family GTPase CgtA-like protein